MTFFQNPFARNLRSDAKSDGLLEQMPKEISKWPRRNGLSARKRQRPMSLDLGLVPLTPQTGHCARAASQAVLKELLEKGLARRGVSGRVAEARQALWGKGPTPLGWPASAPCQRPLGAATISEIYFGICSRASPRRLPRASLGRDGAPPGIGSATWPDAEPGIDSNEGNRD